MAQKPNALTYVTLAALAGCSPEYKEEPKPRSNNNYSIEVLGEMPNVSIEDCDNDGNVDLIRLGPGFSDGNVYIQIGVPAECARKAANIFPMPQALQREAQNAKVALDSLDFRLRKAEFDRQKSRGKQ